MLCQNFPFHWELNFLWPSCGCIRQSAQLKKKKDSSCFRMCMHARKKREPKHERAKKGIENEIALTYFFSAVWFHFNAFLWVDLLVSVFSSSFFSGYNVLCGALPRSSFSFSLSLSVSLTERSHEMFMSAGRINFFVT